MLAEFVSDLQNINWQEDPEINRMETNVLFIIFLTPLVSSSEDKFNLKPWIIPDIGKSITFKERSHESS